MKCFGYQNGNIIVILIAQIVHSPPPKKEEIFLKIKIEIFWVFTFSQNGGDLYRVFKNRI